MASSKTKIARKMLSNKEIKKHIGIFDSKQWNDNKKARAEGIEARHEANRARSIIRKEMAKPKSQSKKDLKKAEALVKKIELKRKKNLKFEAKNKNK